MSTKKPLLGPNVRKIHPKLRMFADGDLSVNSVRSEWSSSVYVSKKVKLSEIQPLDARLHEVRKKKPKVGKISSPTDNISASVFIHYLSEEHAQHMCGKISKIAPHTKEGRYRKNLCTATVPLNELTMLANDNCIAFIEPGESLKAPSPTKSEEKVKAPSVELRRFSKSGNKPVLIGIIDVEGFDFAHDDFLDKVGNTRFVRIWDQGGDNRSSPSDFEYGSEITQKHMNGAISSSARLGMAPQLLEPQSQMKTGSHATHVASIAAGNRGVCRDALIAGVLVDLPPADQDRRRSFYDSTRLTDAVDYLFQLVETLKAQLQLDELPVSINISLGTNGHAHDASSAVSRWVDAALATPGRSVCVAAGNSGQETVGVGRLVEGWRSRRVIPWTMT